MAGLEATCFAMYLLYGSASSFGERCIKVVRCGGPRLPFYQFIPIEVFEFCILFSEC